MAVSGRSRLLVNHSMVTFNSNSHLGNEIEESEKNPRNKNKSSLSKRKVAQNEERGVGYP